MKNLSPNLRLSLTLDHTTWAEGNPETIRAALASRANQIISQATITYSQPSQPNPQQPQQPDTDVCVRFDDDGLTQVYRFRV